MATKFFNTMALGSIVCK